jgi:hypothetical protein
MRLCSKCKLTYGDGSRICRACGAILEEVVDASPWEPTSPTLSLPAASKHDPGEEFAPTEPADAAAADPVPPIQTGSACQSTRVIPGVRVVDNAGDQGKRALQVVVEGQPDALFFKDRLYGQLVADVCGACGHASLRVLNPEELFAQHLKSQSRGDAAAP